MTVYALLMPQGVPAADLTRRIGDVVQYITGAGILALIALCWNIAGRVGNVETLLKDPDQGLSPLVSQIRQRVADLGGEMQSQIGRIEQQADEIRRLRDDERAALELKGRVDVLAKEVEMLRIIADVKAELKAIRGDH